jgi:hypothetical protein
VTWQANTSAPTYKSRHTHRLPIPVSRTCGELGPCILRVFAIENYQLESLTRNLEMQDECVPVIYFSKYWLEDRGEYACEIARHLQILVRLSVNYESDSSCESISLLQCSPLTFDIMRSLIYRAENDVTSVTRGHMQALCDPIRYIARRQCCACRNRCR